MYKYNSNINYQPNGGDWPGLALDLHKQKIYVNEFQYIDIAFENIFKGYVITSEDRWTLTTADFNESQTIDICSQQPGIFSMHPF